MGYESLTISTNAVALTQATYQILVTTGGGSADQGGSSKMRVTAKLATITTEDQPIRVRFDGTAPTSTEGHLIPLGSTIELQSQGQVQKFRAIRASAATGDATIKVTYWGS